MKAADAPTWPGGAPGWQALLSGVEEPAWVIDPDSSRFLDANAQAVDQLGFPKSEILRLGVTDVNRQVSDLATWRGLSSDMQAGDTLVYMAELRCRSGDFVEVEITLSCQLVDGRRVFVAVTRSQRGG